MALPIAYNVRNLLVRKTTTMMTALGIALTVAVLAGVLALLQGLRTSLEMAGHPLQLVVMRRGAPSEIASVLSRAAFQDARLKPGIALGRNGEPLTSLEVIIGINLPNPSPGKAEINITVRGLTATGFELRDNISLASGRMFQSGLREVLVGEALAGRYPELGLGRRIRFGRGEWTVVGIMQAGHAATSSEIFADLNLVAADYYRSEVLSSIRIRAADPAAMEALRLDLEHDRRLNVTCQSEKGYYDSQTVSAAPIKYLGIFISVVLAIGSSFAAMNTMYTVVARRAAEIGTLRVLGFSRAAILTSFLLESLLISGVGGALGCLLVLPLHDLNAGLTSVLTFSEMIFDFRITPAILGAGLGFALVIGGLGGLFPARHAASKQIVAALREA